MPDRGRTFIGIDPASPGGDMTVEVGGRMTPDGKLAIQSAWRYRTTIDGTAVEVSGEALEAPKPAE